MPAFRAKYLSDAVRTGILLKTLHIRPVTKIKYTFDPFTERVDSIRTVMSCLNTKAVLRTSTAQSKINVTSNRCDPEIDIEFNDGDKLVFKTKYLKSSEILEKISLFCNQKDTTELDSDIALTKMSGKLKGKRK